MNQGKFWHLFQVWRPHNHWVMPFSVRPIHFKPLKICKTMDVQNVGFHEKCHISVNMCPTDLRQVSKFSLVTSLKLFLWHPKDLVIRKNIYVLREPKISWVLTNKNFMGQNECNGSHRKWHNSMNMMSSDLGQVSKFSSGRYLKLFG